MPKAVDLQKEGFVSTLLQTKNGNSKVVFSDMSNVSAHSLSRLLGLNYATTYYARRMR
jgi:hypothetical protein